jgi:hypothetical protein
MAEALAPFADDRSDHVLKQLLQKTARGVSRFPMAPGPATHVDEHELPPGSTTMVMGESTGGGIVVSGIDSELAHAGTLDASGAAGLPPQSAVPFVARQPVAADTAQGTVHTVDEAEPRRSPPLLWIGLGLGAVVLMGVAGVAYSGRSASAPDPYPVETSTAAPDPPDPPPPVAPSPEVTVSASVEPPTPPSATTMVAPEPKAPPPTTAAPAPVPTRRPGLPGIDIND